MSYQAELTQLSKDYKRLCEAKEWEQLKELDLQVRNRIKEWVAVAATDEDKTRLASVLQSLKNINSLVLKGAEAHRQQIARELKKLNLDKKAVATYERSSKYL